MHRFSFPFGKAELHFERSNPIEQPNNAAVLYVSNDGESAVCTDNRTDTYYLRESEHWYGLVAFTFSARNRTHFRDYFIHDIRMPAFPAGVYNDGYQGLTEQLRAVKEHGKAKVILAQIRALFEEKLIESVILPLLSSRLGYVVKDVFRAMRKTAMQWKKFSL